MSSPEYLKEWSLAQAYEGDAAGLQQQIEALQSKQARLLDMAGQHRHLMALLLDVPGSAEPA